MRTIDLALKDLRQISRDRRSLLFLIVMPVVFTFFFGLVFTKSPDSSDNRLQVGIVNLDPDGSLSKTLLEMLNSSATVRPVLVEERDGAALDAKILKGDLAAGLVIPAGYSGSSLNGGDPKLEMIINEETDDGQTVRRALQTTIARVTGITQTALLSSRAYEAANGAFASTAERQSYLEEAVESASRAWANAPLSLKAVDAAAKTDDPLSVNPYNQFSPGMIVQFAIFGLIQVAMIMVLERKNGAMSRLLTTPMKKAELIGGHILGMFVVFFLQQLILVVFGQLVLKVDYFRALGGTLLVMVALSLFVASLGLLISTLVKTEDQVVMWAMMAMFIFSALGGAWFSLEMVGKAFSTIGHLMPSAWAIEGFQNIIMRGLGIKSVLMPVGIILAYTLAFFGISIWRFKFE